MLGLGFAGFLVFGVVLVLVGANQPAIARDLGLDLESSGLLVSAIALGVGVGVVGTGPLADRLPRRPLFVAGALLAAAALLAFGEEIGFVRALAQAALLGLAIGAHESLINASVADAYRERAARPMVFVHSAATLGATLTPAAIGWLGAGWHWTASFRATAIAYLLLAAGSLAARFPLPAARHHRSSSLRGVLTPAILPFAVVGFAYVGLETTLTVFAVPYTESLGLGAQRGLTSISTFWLGLLGGRLLLLLVRRRIDARFLQLAGLAGAAALALGIGASLPGVELVFVGVGIVLGFVFPVMIALAAERFPDAPGTATGLVAGSAALGGFSVPWLHGALGDRVGIGTSLALLALWSLAVAAAAWRAQKARP